MNIGHTGEIASHILAAHGLTITDEAQMAINLKSSKPNTDNLIEISNGGQELRFGADGMPLLGGYPNSYDRAPTQYARSYGDYPRPDSHSRLAANQSGAQMNLGAAHHLTAYYPATIAILDGLTRAERHKADIQEDDNRQLTVNEAREVLHGAIWMWSYMSYRKQGRSPKNKLPSEVALLHRAMSGVKMSLQRLYVTDRTHAHTIIPGAHDREFTSESWSSEVETHGLLVSPDKLSKASWLTSPEIEAYEKDHQEELCPAPTKMIRHVLSTIIEPPSQDRAIDIETTYQVAPRTLLAYGNALARLEFARLTRNRATSFFGEQLIKRMGPFPVITPATIRELDRDYGDEMSEIARTSKRERDTAFTEAIDLLGYDTSRFKAAKSAM